jgi:hypothetical protein
VAVTVGRLAGEVTGAGLGLAMGTVGTASGKGASLLAQAASNKGNIQRNTSCQRRPPTRAPKMAVCLDHGKRNMLLILLEALLAGGILVFIVWWTMFSGRRQGERRDDE